MRILFIGGSGTVSLPAVYKLRNNGHDVFTFTRGSKNHVLPDGIGTYVGERSNTQHLREVLESEQIEVVVDMCAYNVDDVTTIVDALTESISHYVLFSSIAVYDFPGNNLLTNGEGSAMRKYGYNKLLCEQFLKKNLNIALSVIRPTYVYAPYDTSERIKKIADMILSSDKITVPANLNKYKAHLVYVDDLTNASCDIIENEHPTSDIYDLVYPEEISFIDVIHEIAHLLNRDTEIVFTDDVPDFPFMLNSNQTINNHTAWKKLGIQPENDMRTGIAKVGRFL